MIEIYAGNNLSFIANYEFLFKNGDVGELRLYLSSMLNYDEVAQLNQDLLAQGVNFSPIVQDANIVIIGFTETGNTLANIASINVPSLLGWQLLKNKKTFPTWAWLAVGMTAGWLVYRLGK